MRENQLIRKADAAAGNEAQCVDLLSLVADSFLEVSYMVAKRGPVRTAAGQEDLHQHGFPLLRICFVKKALRFRRHRCLFVKQAGQQFIPHGPRALPWQTDNPFPVRRTDPGAVCQIRRVQQPEPEGLPGLFVSAGFLTDRGHLFAGAALHLIPRIRRETLRKFT